MNLFKTISRDSQRTEGPLGFDPEFSPSIIRISKDSSLPESQPSALLLSLGKSHFRKSNFSQAFRIFESYVTKEPKDAEAWYWLGMCQAMSSPSQSATDSFENSIQLSRTPDQMIQKIGDFYFKHQKFELFKGYYLRLNLTDMYTSEALISIGQKLLTAECFSSALECFIKASKDIIIGCSFEITWCYLMLERNSEALTAFESVPKNHPSYLVCCIRIAEIRYQRANYGLSLNLFLEVLKTDFFPEHSYLGTIASLYQLSRFKEATVYCKAAIQFFPTHSVFFYFLSDLFAFQGQTQDCIKTLRKIALVFPDNQLAMSKLYQFYDAIGDYENSLKYLLMSHKKDPLNEELVIKITVTYKKLSDLDDCRIWRKELQEIFCLNSEIPSISDKFFVADKISTSNNGSRINHRFLDVINNELDDISHLFSSLSLSIVPPGLKGSVHPSNQDPLNTKTSLIFEVHKFHDQSLIEQAAQTYSFKFLEQSSANLNQYSQTVESLLSFLMHNDNLSFLSTNQRLENVHYKFSQFCLECAFFVDYNRHAMNCDVICSEMADPVTHTRECIQTVKSLLRPEFINNLCENLHRLSVYKANLEWMIKSIAVKLSHKKKKVIEKNCLPTRLQKYSQNLSKYMESNIKETEHRASKSKRLKFFTQFNSLSQFGKESKGPSAELASTHFLCIIMILATKDLVNLDFNALQTADSMVNQVLSATNFEVG